MIMPYKDKMYNGRKGISFENPSYFCKAKELRPSLYDERVIDLGYTPMFLTHSNEALEIKKFKRARENKIEFAYDYGNLNASSVNEKINFSDEYFQEIINPDFEKIYSPFQQTSSLKPYVLTVILEKIIIDLEDEVVSLLEKEKENLEIIESLKSKGFELSENAISESENQSENDCQVVEKSCDNLENSKVITPGMFKINVSQSVSPISVSKTCSDSNNVENKPKRKRRKRTSSKQNDKQVNNDVLRANRDFVNFSNLDTLSSVRRPKHKDTRSAYACNDAINVSCKSRLHAFYDVNDLFVFDDVVPKMQSLAEPVVKWIPKVERQIDKISKTLTHQDPFSNGYPKFVECNHALLTSFVEKFLGTVRFGNNDFAVIAGYGDVVIRSMTIKKVYYVEGKIHQKHHKSKTAFALNKPLYLLHMDLCGLMRIESINGKRYVLVVVDDYSRYTWVFSLRSKDEAFEVLISFIKKTQVNLQLQVQRVQTNNGTEFKNKTLAKLFDEVGIAQ
ncbi:retrovirus-related pol polyprotein from transposon TNT 1-94 [Tanacetum coccineum]